LAAASARGLADDGAEGEREGRRLRGEANQAGRMDSFRGQGRHVDLRSAPRRADASDRLPTRGDGAGVQVLAQQQQRGRSKTMHGTADARTGPPEKKRPKEKN